MSSDTGFQSRCCRAREAAPKGRLLTVTLSRYGRAHGWVKS